MNQFLSAIVLIVVVEVNYFVSAQNFCDPKLCSPGVTNTGCRNNGAFAPACPRSVEMVPITEDLKAVILDIHNSKRNILASGKLPKFSPARRMGTLQWDDTLAQMASFNAKRCTFAHDRCRNTPQFLHSGQNIGKSWWSGMEQTDLELTQKLINDWWGEYKDATMAQMNKYFSSGKVIGHFTAMALDKSTHVGCSEIRYPEDGMNTFTIVCNYASTNFIDHPIYVAGPTASGCTTGVNPKYRGLCSVAEPIDPNDI